LSELTGFVRKIRAVRTPTRMKIICV